MCQKFHEIYAFMEFMLMSFIWLNTKNEGKKATKRRERGFFKERLHEGRGEKRA